MSSKQLLAVVALMLVITAIALAGVLSSSTKSVPIPTTEAKLSPETVIERFDRVNADYSYGRATPRELLTITSELVRSFRRDGSPNRNQDVAARLKHVPEVLADVVLVDPSDKDALLAIGIALDEWQANQGNATHSCVASSARLENGKMVVTGTTTTC
nr:hypothetical protein [uncultured archaeon]